MLMDRIKIQCWWDKQNLVSGENFVAGFTKVRIKPYVFDFLVCFCFSNYDLFVKFLKLS